MNRIILLAALVFAGCTTTAMQSKSKTPVDLRVMSFNVRYATAPDGPNHWNLRQGAVLAAIEAFNPDILATQETLAVQRDFIAENLPHYAAVGVGRDDGKEQGEMTATFYRRDRFDLLASGHFWLSETPEVPGSKSWDTAITRMATWLKLRDRRSESAAPLLVINTHFDHMGEQARLESAKLLRRQAEVLGHGCSIVILGDLNCDEDSAPYTELAARRVNSTTLIDVYRKVNPLRQKNEATFQAFKPDAIAGNRIDFIFASEDLATLSAAIDRDLYSGKLASDHFPVTAVVGAATQK